ncbi:hypothetical protein WJX74_004373 [Apatococcus lobatus]|uniref:Uncharacterized protein n=1 Tax=Apatococcus lobatus TaxID=904363 RepID=A0AAW1QCU5_9CHLO
MSAADGDTDSTAQGTPPRGLPQSHVSLTSAAATGDVKDLEGQLGWLRECLDQCQNTDSSASCEAAPAPSQTSPPKQPPQLQHTAATEQLQFQNKQDAINSAHQCNDSSLAALAAKPGELTKRCLEGAILTANDNSCLPSSGNQAEPASKLQVPQNVGLQLAAPATSPPALDSDLAGIGQHAGNTAEASNGQHGAMSAAQCNAARALVAKQASVQPDKPQADSSVQPVSPSTRRDRPLAQHEQVKAADWASKRHVQSEKKAGADATERVPAAAVSSSKGTVVGSVNPEAAAPSLDALDPYLREPYETWGQEELAAKFLLAYHQSAGGPWPLLPRLWVDRAIGRDFYPFIQARKAGQGKAPRWAVESPKSKEHPAERELEFEVFQRLVDVLEASPSGWAVPAAALGEGHDTTVLAKLRHLAIAYRCNLLPASDWQLANEHLKLDRILACACEQYPPDPATPKTDKRYKPYRLIEVSEALHTHLLPHVKLQPPPQQPAVVGKGNIPCCEQDSFIIVDPTGLTANWVDTKPRLDQWFELLSARAAKEAPAAQVHLQLLQTSDSMAATCKEQTFTLGELEKVMLSLPDPVIQSLKSIMDEMKQADQKWQQDLQASPPGAAPPCMLSQHSRLVYQDTVAPGNVVGIVWVRWLPYNPAGSPAGSSETSSGMPSPAWSKVVESRLGKLEKQEGQFDAALWAEAQLRGCVSRCLPDDELAEEHFKLLVRMVEASQRRLSLKSPAYEQSRKASSATHLPAYQATCQDRMLQPSEEQLVKRQLKLEGKVYRIRQQPDNASHDSDSEEDLSRQSIEERVRIAIHRHVLHRSSRNWHPRVPIPRDASGEVVGVCTSLILLNPCTDEASRVSLTRQACKERAEAYILSSPTASVTVETFVEEGRMLPFHKVDCFRLVDLRIVRHGLQDFALAAIVDIMDSVDRADRAWLQSLEAYLPGHARPCRVQDFKRLVYCTMVASGRLHGIVHIRRLPQCRPAGSTVAVGQAQMASSASPADAADRAGLSPAEGDLPQASKPPQQSARSHADASTLPAEQGTKADIAASSDSCASTASDSHEQASKARMDAGTEKGVRQRLAKQSCPKREARRRSEELMARELKEERNRQAWARIGKEPPPPKDPKPVPSSQQKKATASMKPDVDHDSSPGSGSSVKGQPAPDVVTAAQEAACQPRSSASTFAQKPAAAAAAAASDPNFSLGCEESADAAASGAEPSSALESVVIAPPDSPPDSLQGQLASCDQPEQVTSDDSSEDYHDETDHNDDDVDEDDDFDSDHEQSSRRAAMKADVAEDAMAQADARDKAEKTAEASKKVVLRAEQAAEAIRASEEAALMELTRRREANAAALLREEETAAKAAEARKEARRRKQAQRRARDKAKLHHMPPHPPFADALNSAAAGAVPGLSHSAASDVSLPQSAMAGSSHSTVQQRIANSHDDSGALLASLDSNEPATGLAAAGKPESRNTSLAAAASVSAGTLHLHSLGSAISDAPSGMQQQGSSKTHARHAHSPAPNSDAQSLQAQEATTWPIDDPAQSWTRSQSKGDPPGKNTSATEAMSDMATATNPQLASHVLHGSSKSNNQAASPVEASAGSSEQSQRGSTEQSSSNAAADNSMQPAQTSKQPRQRSRTHAQRISIDKNTSPPPDASGMNHPAQLQESPARAIQKMRDAPDAGVSTASLTVLDVSNPVAAAASAPEPDIMPLVQSAQAGRASDTNSTATAGGQFARPKPMGLHRRLASQGMAPSPARPVPKGRALREAPAAPNIESLLAEIFQNNQAANTPANERMKHDADVASSASFEHATDPPEAAQLMESMAAAMATIGQASAALTASIHQAASWLGQHRAQAANLAQQDQVQSNSLPSSSSLMIFAAFMLPEAALPYRLRPTFAIEAVTKC